MVDNKRKLSLLSFILIGLVASALFGMAVSYLLLGKPQAYRENRLWKFTVLFYFFTILYIYWNSYLTKYLPILLNLFKFIGLNLILLLPYSSVLIIVGNFSIGNILTYLPSHIIFLSAFFIWYVASEIEPELVKNSFKIWGVKKTAPVIILYLIITIIIEIKFFEIPEVIWLSLLTILGLMYSLLLLKRALKNIPLESYQEQEYIKKDGSEKTISR